MGEVKISAPMPGVFYRRPSPDEDMFVELGDEAEAGETLGLVEVMKQFHEIKADDGGTVKEFLVDNEEAVEGGQAVVVIET